ncbi:LysR family transcriptional regulator [Salinibius halmophilus]|uniref:LysR family transcriptional regulator n=1 Tax=Salinibius halmophilus TaxID=1853216 RepID=UPI000E6664E5|nr:LysR family transcriptional regulator [Salinibius halmophilus]
MPSIDQLRCLRAVVEHKSLASAAAKLHKTQPALSHALKQLEATLGVAVFDRSGYRLALTGEGNALYELALQVLNSHDTLVQTAHHYALGNEEQIVLAIEASFPIEKIASALKATQQRFPHTNIVLQQEYLSGAFEQLQHQHAHIAITPLPDDLIKPSLFETVRLNKGRLINVLSSEMAAKHAPLVSIKQLINEYQILVRDSGGMTKGVKLDVQTAQRYWYVNNFSTKLSLIKQGMGWGKLPEYLVQSDLKTGTLVHVKLDDFTSVTEFHYKLAKRKGQVLGPVGNMLWHEISQMIGRSDD